ncbi:MAG TPA: hypothetical protein VJ976_01680 [Ornithinimicrobium sp.]|uniref:hypothetical protein n=1 Tax=Ornithinimicrobium sp. TaxID=1977084 RepID=UPI002B467A3A|nr:hypothetical protein [Ornithinimicrobium sp.]HKJ11080.1 hypothetical protein [Ornithinimicrobium sp.]
MALADSRATEQSGSATQPDGPVTRVSLREIREVTFRALSARGASHGEAWVAARMVLDAQIQGEDGISLAVQDVRAPRWRREEVPATEPPGRGDPVVLHAQAGTMLRYGPLALDLAMAEAGLHGVFVPGVTGGETCLESLLCEAASAHATTVVARRAHGGRWGPVHLARPDGCLARGDVADSAAAVTDAGVAAADGDGLLVTSPCPSPWLAEGEGAWVTPQQRAERRREVAQHGALVPAEAWRSLYDASRRYLVP